MPVGHWKRMGRLAVALVVISAISPAQSSKRSKSRTARPAARPAAASVDVPGRVTEVRFWSNPGATRVAIELNGPFEYRADRLNNPERLFFDLPRTKPARNPKGVEIIPVGDALIRQIRVAETVPGTTRIVLDLNASVEHSASQLANPDRLVVEIRPTSQTGSPLAPPLPPPLQTTRAVEPAPMPAPAPAPAAVETALPPVRLPERPITRSIPPAAAPKPAPVETVDTRSKTSMAEAGAAVESAAPPPATRTPEPKPGPPVAAKRNSTGQQSLTRVLGLKLGRVVLDPGHGGHDVGTQGPTGLLEKELVLDITKRLGALIEERMGSEVIYTRQDDTFIPLEQRTQIANRQKADLFLSIHANSSPVRTASGVETYYLNFTTDKSALEVAARENASSERSIFELGDLVRQIARKDKVDESREFAKRIQTSMSTMAGRGKTRDRGVRKAPFVVLIGAAMPSVLAEIGFISNPQEEALMKKPEHRQKIAEALYKGLSQYASTLSRFEMAGGSRRNSGDE
jgi:N-acetylmuramoyl-L-alanine amidase